uniref:Uncharacterized protein n=1 Tax=Arundo donax TaxID=35708 RepID=A0A0A8ZY20_ARUDO
MCNCDGIQYINFRNKQLTHIASSHSKIVSNNLVH